MASVTSLDKDLRKLRLEKYTPAAANEIRAWIEGALGERLPAGDLLEALKDGVALCRLINLAVGRPGVKFKQSAMPFVQMENISQFLRACQSPPLNLHQHDMFLTVDLYEQKDPAQVVQCLVAFSRAANSANPSAFPTVIGPKTGTGRNGNSAISPQPTGLAPPSSSTAASTLTPTTTTTGGLRSRGISNASNPSSSSSSSLLPKAPAFLTPSKTGDGRWNSTKSSGTGTTSTINNNGASTGPPGSPANVSTWSRREHEGSTAPAWNIAQYGYMGGASQGNLGISFGGRRQITSAAPFVPNAHEKERRRKEQEAGAERQRLQMAEEEEKRRQAEEEHRWEEDARRTRDEERRKTEEEKRRWEEEERQWKMTEERRRREEEEAEARLQQERQRNRAAGGGGSGGAKNDARLQGQLLSQYKAEQESKGPKSAGGAVDYSSRVKELEKELELARQREAEYERERQERARRQGGGGAGDDKNRARSRSRNAAAASSQIPSRQESWSVRDDQEFSRKPFQRASSRIRENENETEVTEPNLHSESELDLKFATVTTAPNPSRSPRPLPDPATLAPPPVMKVKTHKTGGEDGPPLPIRKQHTGSRPLPDPSAYTKSPPSSAATPKTPPVVPTNKPAAATATPQSRTDKFLASNPAPQQTTPQATYARELGTTTAERDEEDRRRGAAQTHTKAGGWASKTLLEREMELERQRQREWEEAQKETAARSPPSGSGSRDGQGQVDGGVDGIGGGVGGRWDVGQWAGYTGGDNQNRGAQGIGAGRRQIVGPRPLPGRP